MVKLPKGTFVQVTTVGRHRNKELWGETADQFDPDRDWEDDELWHDQVYAARNPHSRRFSPFTHTPRDCIGKNFAQMEMRSVHVHVHALEPPHTPPVDQPVIRLRGPSLTGTLHDCADCVGPY